MSTEACRGSAECLTVARRGRFHRLRLLAAILMSALAGGCDPQGPEFFEIVSVPGTGNIQGMVTVDAVSRPDAVVVLGQNGTTVDTFVTDEEGRFAFPNLQPGSYTLSTTIQGVECDEATAEVEADRQIEVDLTCSTPTTGTVGGRVTVNGAGEAGVSLRLREGMTILATTTTDEAGGYEFSGVPPGVKVLEMDPPEGATCQTTQRNVTITAGGTATVDFACTRT
jgi:hypothetical protein